MSGGVSAGAVGDINTSMQGGHASQEVGDFFGGSLKSGDFTVKKNSFMDYAILAVAAYIAIKVIKK